MNNEVVFSPENNSKKFESFFYNAERKNAFLDQILDNQEIESPNFAFHTTSQRSIENRMTEVADEKWFSFSKDAWHSLKYLDYRFLDRLKYAGQGIDPTDFEPVFLIANYEKLKTNPNFKEKHGREANEIEIQVPFKELELAAMTIKNSEEFQNLVDFIDKNTPNSEHKIKALKALRWNLEDWQQIEKLKIEKTL